MSDIDILAYQPNNQETGVSPDTEIFVSAYSPSLFNAASFSATINGINVYDTDTGKFLTPDYVGTLSFPAPGYLTARFKPRKSFLYNVNVTVEITLVSSEDEIGADPEIVRFSFLTRNREKTLQNTDIRVTEVDAPFEKLVALEAYRRTLTAGLRKDFSIPSVVALYHRVSSCSLSSVTYYVPFSAASKDEVELLTGHDVISLDEAVVLLSSLAPLWEIALRELGSIGVSEQLLRLLFQAGSSANPSERVGAACAAVLLATQKLIDS